jgi:hypothetical protein
MCKNFLQMKFFLNKKIAINHAKQLALSPALHARAESGVLHLRLEVRNGCIKPGGIIHLRLEAQNLSQVTIMCRLHLNGIGWHRLTQMKPFCSREWTR